MKLILQDGSKYVLRFDAGEEVSEGLLNFARQYEIDAAAFSGIGACSLAEVAYYDPHIKGYQRKIFSEELEITALIGNLGTFAGKPAFHAHGVFTKTDFTTIGGHVFKIVISATCEIFLTKLQGMLERKHNGNINLNLLN